jgi:hypothetical protein
MLFQQVNQRLSAFCVVADSLHHISSVSDYRTS